MIGWLKAELARIKLAEHQLVLRRVHLTTLIMLVLLAGVLGLVVGFGAGYRYPYKTVAPPPVPPGQRTPSCSARPSEQHTFAKSHGMGDCLPQSTVQNRASITATTQGPDFSNNDPVSCSQMAQLAPHNAFVELKVNQGNYYTDRTAAGMARCAKALHLVVGGYDFLDVCHQSPQSEADVFVADARADGLLSGPGVLPPDADAEYPTGSLSCNARDYVLAWLVEVHRLTGRWGQVYTGGWWWNPHIGCWWPGNSISWISGYVSASSILRFLPCGLSHLDIWQFSDAGWNGATTADLSVWRAGVSAFNQAANAGPDPAHVRSWIKARGSSLSAYYRGPHLGYGCHQPVLTSSYCGQHAWRVDHFQKLIDTAHGYYPRCFGRSRDLGAAECRIVRPAVAVWSNARSSTGRAEGNNGCHTSHQQSPICRVLNARYLYFDRRAGHSVASSRY